MPVTTALVFLLSALAPADQGQAPITSIVQDIRDREYAPVRRNLIAAAAAMPASGYGFIAAEGVRSFGDELAHAAAVNFRLCGLASGAASRPAATAPPAAAATADADARKAAIAERLEASFAACDAVLASMSDDALLTRTVGPYVRASHLVAMAGHINHVYGKVALMLRLKGIVPPSSAGR